MLKSVILFLVLIASAVGLKLQHKILDWRAPKELVIIRAYNARPGLVDRIKAITEDFLENMPKARLLISVDTTRYQPTRKNNYNSTAEVENVVKAIKAKTPSAMIHLYNETDVTKEYPQYITLPKNGPSRGYNYHIEPYVLAFNWAQEHFQMQFDYGWAVEDDVVVCGQFSQLMKAHTKDNSDMLSFGKSGRADGGFQAGMSTKKFKERYTHAMYIAKENVQRYSTKLIFKMNDLMKDGVEAQSEVFPTTIAQSEDFKYSQLDHTFAGKIQWNNRMNKKQATETCAKHASEGETKLYHAGKYTRIHKTASEVTFSKSLPEQQEDDQYLESIIPTESDDAS